jgi:hypothetical protein
MGGIYHAQHGIVKYTLDKDKLVFVSYYSSSASKKATPRDRHNLPRIKNLTFNPG